MNLSLIIIIKPQDVPAGEGVWDGVGCAHHKKVQPGWYQIKAKSSKETVSSCPDCHQNTNSFKEILRQKMNVTILFRTSGLLATLSPISSHRALCTGGIAESYRHL